MCYREVKAFYKLDSKVTPINRGAVHLEKRPSDMNLHNNKTIVLKIIELLEMERPKAKIALDYKTP